MASEETQETPREASSSQLNGKVAMTGLQRYRRKPMLCAHMPEEHPPNT